MSENSCKSSGFSLLSVDFVVARPSPMPGCGAIRSTAVSRHPPATWTPVTSPLGPSDALRRMRDRAHTPRVALVSAGVGGASPWSRWSVVGTPSATRSRCLWDADLPTDAARARASAIDFLREVCAPTMPPNAAPHQPPWMLPLKVLVLSYELGRVLEPSPSPRRDGSGVPEQVSGSGRRHSDARVPLISCLELDSPLLHDSHTGRWWASDPASPEAAMLARFGAELPATGGDWRLSAPAPTSSRAAFERRVARAVRLIHEGDVFQVNLSHDLAATFEGDHRAFFADLCDSARPWFGAMVEWPPLADGAAGGFARPSTPVVLSASPELFLSFDPISRRVVTRPIKGTRPLGVEPSELMSSEKDRAELSMIIDLMRNDLGRSCATGSVRVDEARGLESHRVHHTVATVSGELSPGKSVADLLEGSFPPGSITGAPKVRAMQIIEELEGRARGVYCGSIALLDAAGRLSASVAIRTATLDGAPGGSGPRELVFPVGAGVVAESDPAGEWDETLAKAAALRALQSSHAVAARAP